MEPVKITAARWGLSLVLLLALGMAFALLVRAMTGGGSAALTGGSTGVVADFTLPDLTGRSVNLAAFTAGRPFVISFGTTSCPYCTLQLTAFRELARQFGDRVAILEVNVGEPADRVAAHVARLESPFTTLLDRDGAVFLRYGSDAVPVTIVADATGRIIEVGGYLPAAHLAKLLGPTVTARTTAGSPG